MVILLWLYTKFGQVNFSSSVILKSFNLSCILNGSFTYEWFCNIMHSPFGTYFFTKLYRSFKCWHIHWKYFLKSQLLINHHQSYEKSCQVHQYKFSKIWIFTWKLEFYPWQQILPTVFSEMTCSHCSFARKWLLYTHTSITKICQFFQVRKVFH